MISVKIITDNIDLYCSMSWLFCLAFALSLDAVVFGQLYYANIPAVPRELSACCLKESRTPLKSEPFQTIHLRICCWECSYLFRKPPDKQESQLWLHSFLKCKMSCVKKFHTQLHLLKGPSVTLALGRRNVYNIYQCRKVCSSFFPTTFHTLLHCHSFSMYHSCHSAFWLLAKYWRNKWGLILVLLLLGKRPVNIVTVDHFLGKQPSQGGAADNFIFCKETGEEQGKVYNVWQLPDDNRK